ncbi:MAG: hypothetical protein SGILL_005074, partial [Bacillariaceae sp.]
SKEKKKSSSSGGPASANWVSILSLMGEEKAEEPLLLEPTPPPPTTTTTNNNSNCYVYPTSAFPSLEKFDVSLKVPALIIPAKRTNEIRKRLKPIMLQRPRLRVVVEVVSNSNNNNDDNDKQESLRRRLLPMDLPANQCRMLVLDPLQVKLMTGCDDDDRDHQASPQDIPHHPLLQPLLSGQKEEAMMMTVHTIELKYQDWTADELLRRLLPPELEIPSAFEVVGSLAHMNLREEQLPYKYIIGRVLLDKHQPSIKTIVNKLGSIDTTYRTFGMEVIAGIAEGNWSEVSVKEEGCLYKLDFQKVYWNSRLGGEHRRLVKDIRKDAAAAADKKRQPIEVADLMAGIGPFAVPLTATTLKANQESNAYGGDEQTEPAIIVHANDLNPASYKYLKINHKVNKCGDALKMYNMDGRAFCHRLQDQGIVVDHAIMNLPASALEFLDAFRGYKVAKTQSNGEDKPDHLPMIHVYGFAPKNVDEAKQSIYERAEKALGCSLNDTDVSIYEVRDVAPKKNMYCITFRLPTAVQSLPRVEIASPPKNNESKEEAEPEQKRQKVDG